LWDQSPEELEQTFEAAKHERAHDKALKCLDIIRLVDQARWERHQGEIEPLLNEIDIANARVKQIKEAIRRGESLADANVREPLARGAAEYGDDPEWQLRAHRWQLLAEFCGGLADGAPSMFREEGRPAWIQAVEAMEEEKWAAALDLFWEPLQRLVSPNLDQPALEARIMRARELLHAGQRIEAQGEIEATIAEAAAFESPALSAALDLVHNALLPRYSRWGGILALLIEAELRQHMLDLAANLSLGRQSEVYASAEAIRRLQPQLAYAPLLEAAGLIWPEELLKSLDQQLELCQKAAEVLAEAAGLLEQGKFEQARWILSATDRQFDFSKPGQPDSDQSLLAEVSALTQVSRQQLKAELKRATDSIQAEQLLARTKRSDDVSQVLTALEAAGKVLDLAYLRPHAAGLIDQVTYLLRSGPALVTLEDKER
jgi:anti-sigma28 factor (negative regulator of flagellin synthesis)